MRVIEGLAEVRAHFADVTAGEERVHIALDSMMSEFGMPAFLHWAHVRRAHVLHENIDKLARVLNRAGSLERQLEPWAPVDVEAVLASGLNRLEPTQLPREDGLCLLYPGKTHSLAGESGSGKSWLAQYAAMLALNDGERVLYLDYESDAASVVARLLALGAMPECIARRFVYVNPDAAPEGVGSRTCWPSLARSRWWTALRRR